MADILKEIVEYKKDFVLKRKREISQESLEQRANLLKKDDIFTSAIKAKIAANEQAFICEIKKASPSLGAINLDINVAEQAQKYAEYGATCLSILTDEKYFCGSDLDINKAKSATKLPILRKDFIIDPYQIYETKLIGGDAILLIMAALSQKQAQEFEEIAIAQGLGVLIESHTEADLEKALTLKSPLLGINNRDLKSLKISLDVTANLATKIPKDRIIISESGISKKEDLTYLTKSGAQAFLIGTSLMKEEFRL